jgi:outer membrane protein assembly factor BamB
MRAAILHGGLDFDSLRSRGNEDGAQTVIQTEVVTMSRGSRSRGSLILVSAAALFLPFLFAPVHASADARVSLETESAPPGGSFLAAARGFGPYEAIDVFLDGRETTLVLADERGNVDDVLVEVPARTAPGAHWLTLVGRRTGRVVQETVSVDTDWTQLGFDAARAGVNPFEHRLRPSLADELRVVWERELAAQGWSEDPTRTFASPAVVDGVVYVAPSGAFVDRGPRGIAYAFDARTGRTVWSAPGIGVVMASPAVAGNLVLLNAGYPFRVVALHADTGRVVWTRATVPEDLSLEGENWQAISPVVVGDTLYVSVQANVGGPHRVRSFERTYALDLGTGAVRWSRELTGHLAVSGGVVYVGGEELHALSTVSGETLWSRSIVQDAWIGAPAVASGTVYAGGTRGGGEARLYALETSGGAIRWSVELPTAVAARPAVAGGVVYALSVRGVVHAVPTSGGGTLWSVRTWDKPGGKDASMCSEGVCPGPSVANGVVYVGSLGRSRYRYPGRLYALDAATGRELLERNVSRQVMSTPAVVDGMVFVASLDGTLHAFGAPGLAPIDVARPRVASLKIDDRLLPDRTHEIEALTASWERVVSGGLDRSANATAASTTEFDGALYVATQVRAGADWGAEIWRSTDGVSFERVVADGFGDPENRSIELAVHDGRLWATSSNLDGFQVWSSQDGNTFERVASAERSSAEHATPVVFGEHLLLLVDDERNGAEIQLLGGDGTFRTVAQGGLGDSANIGFAELPSRPDRHGVVFREAFYVGTMNGSGGAIWRSTGVSRWEAVATEGLRDPGNVALVPQIVFRDRLYAVSRNAHGLEVYRTADGERWERVVADGLGAGPQRNVTGSLAAVGDPPTLILVTRNVSQMRVMPDGSSLEVGVSGGFQVYRSVYGGRWAKVARDGLGDHHAYAGAIVEEGGVLYLAAQNSREGDSVWRSTDGRTWEPFFREPKASPLTTEINLTVFDGHLVVLHGDLARGLSAWRYLPQVPMTPEAIPPAVPTASPAPAVDAAADEAVTWFVVAAVVLIGIAVVALAIWLIRRRARPTGRATRGPGVHLGHGHA